MVWVDGMSSIRTSSPRQTIEEGSRRVEAFYVDVTDLPEMKEKRRVNYIIGSRMDIQLDISEDRGKLKYS